MGTAEKLITLTSAKEYPECPLYNHGNCREIDNPNLCAIVRKDKNCLRGQSRKRKKAQEAQVPDCLYTYP